MPTLELTRPTESIAKTIKVKALHRVRFGCDAGRFVRDNISRDITNFANKHEYQLELEENRKFLHSKMDFVMYVPEEAADKTRCQIIGYFKGLNKEYFNEASL